MLRKLYKDTNFDKEKYDIQITDKSTGEILNTSDRSIIFRKLTGESSFSSKNYCYLDTDRLSALIKKDIKYNELGVLMFIITNISFRNNVCMIDNGDGRPHTTKTISELLKISQQATKKILNRLMELDVISQQVLKNNKQLGKVYCVNPHLLRRGKKFDSSIDVMFDDLL